MKSERSLLVFAILFLSFFIGGCTSSPDESKSKTATPEKKSLNLELLNVSYDPTRELYEEYNKIFSEHWNSETGQTIKIRQSHGGSGSQARTVIEGNEADVVTLALAYDITAIEKSGLIDPGWQNELEYNSSPYYSTIVFLVRTGNPKGIHDWNDLTAPGVGVITPNPKTSGGARWNFLAAYGYALKQNNGDENAAKEFVRQIFSNVQVLDSGARGSTTTFAEREIGDVLITWENEAFLAISELGPERFEMIVPSISILAEPPVTVVDKFALKHKTTEAAFAYLKYLYSPDAQELIAKHFYRPRLESVMSKYSDRFENIPMFTIDEMFGGWDSAQAKFFNDGGIFDEIYSPGN